MIKASHDNRQRRTYNRIIFVLSLIGMLIAIYVTQSFLRKTSIVCVNTGCETVRKSASSYLLGMPVPLYGLIGYSILVILTFLRTTSESLEKKLLPYIIGIASGGVAFVTWFTYTEIFIIKAICTWCALSAVNMIVVCILAWRSHIYAEGSTQS